MTRWQRILDPFRRFDNWVDGWLRSWRWEQVFSWAGTVKVFARMRIVSWRFWGLTRGNWFIGVINFQPSSVPPDEPVTPQDRSQAEKWSKGFVAADELSSSVVNHNNAAWERLR